jgi:hypothetical protein
MAQGDLNVANQSGAAFRADLNNQLAALGTLQSGASAPSTTFAYMLWADTTTGILKLRNAANSAWINVGTLASTNLGLALAASPTFTGTATFTGDITMSGTGFLDVPVGTTAQRPASPTSGMVRFNTTTAQFEGYGTAAWSQLGNTALSGTNRIINGDMRIDQRNAGAAVTIPAAALTYVMDRWAAWEETDGAISVQRIADAPAGFINSARVTVTTADATLAATQNTSFRQLIEGFNAADLSFGTAGARTFTVSFWVKSSLTGTFAGSIQNSDSTRSYPFSYSIAAANTWEYKTITVPGDTAGAWLTNAGIGLALFFNMGTGSTFSGTAGAWVASNIISVTGSVNLINTLNATWQITGVQLEAGTVATPFAFRSHGEELALCQRYYYKTDKGFSLQSYGASAGENTYAHFSHPVPMRAAPTASATFIGGVNNQSQTVTPSAQSFTIQLVSNGGASYAITYSIGNTFTAEL